MRWTTINFSASGSPSSVYILIAITWSQFQGCCSKFWSLLTIDKWCHSFLNEPLSGVADHAVSEHKGKRQSAKGNEFSVTYKGCLDDDRETFPLDVVTQKGWNSICLNTCYLTLQPSKLYQYCNRILNPNPGSMLYSNPVQGGRNLLLLAACPRRCQDSQWVHDHDECGP